MCNDLNIPETDTKKEFEAIVRMLIADAPECKDHKRTED
jgi:hypothetical protein